MMLERKFIFETKGTRIRRYFRNGLFILMSTGALFALLCLLFIHVSNEENILTQNMLIKRSPDIIVVFTGDAGRIPYALSVLKRNPKAHLLITGVSAHYTLEKFINAYKDDFDSLDLNEVPITLDSLASNTVENVIYSLRHIEKKAELNNILIVSHDYHIMRIKMILNTINTSLGRQDFYFLGLKTDFKHFRNLKILSRETFKMLKALGFLILWEKQDASFIKS
jgi:uncharacterized SAM-binding protein YcdF (DUF218 family)